MDIDGGYSITGIWHHTVHVNCAIHELAGGPQIPMNLHADWPSGIAYNPLSRTVYWTNYMLYPHPVDSAIGKFSLNVNGTISDKKTVSIPDSMYGIIHDCLVTIFSSMGLSFWDPDFCIFSPKALYCA